MKRRIIGRVKEIEKLEHLYASDSSEFVAVCGRRRIGKTFLVREFFEKKLVFSVSGLANSSTAEQLANFCNALRRYSNLPVESVQTWQDAFEALIRYLVKVPQRRKVIFLDELPWMDTPKSNFVSSLEAFWNGWASGRHDILLIVCGSATSWMVNKLINNHGGLHNRLTRQIFLEPFTLFETDCFLRRRGIDFSRYELAECYMIFGGIPYYLNLLDSSLSLSQNIDQLFFQKNGELHFEFDNLFASLFRHSEDYIKIILALGKRRDGMTRQELQAETQLPSGGNFTSILENLEHCGFLRQYSTACMKRNTKIYQLIDFYTLFYLHFLKNAPPNSSNFWQALQGTASFYSWAGLTFELLVLHHIPQLKHALGINGILSSEYAYRTETPKAQIDLLLDRQDNTISLCEAKFTEGQFVFSDEEEQKLRNRLLAVKNNSPKHKSVQVVLITTFGIAGHQLRGIIQREITLEDLLTPLPRI